MDPVTYSPTQPMNLMHQPASPVGRESVTQRPSLSYSASSDQQIQHNSSSTPPNPSRQAPSALVCFECESVIVTRRPPAIAVVVCASAVHPGSCWLAVVRQAHYFYGQRTIYL